MRIRREEKENFTWVHNTFIRDNRLSAAEMGLLLIMISLPMDWSFSVTGLTAMVSDGRDKVRSIIKALEEHGYLVREQQTDKRGNFRDVLYKFSDEPIFLQASESPSEGQADVSDITDIEVGADNTEKPDNKGSASLNKKPSADLPISEKPSYTNKNINKRKIYKSTIKDIMCCKAATDMAVEEEHPVTGSSSTEMKGNKADNISAYTEIIDHLNMKAQSHYRPTTIATQYLIDSLIEQGFSLNDFKTVIDRKCAEWLGTEMTRYLRPQTLFGPKFESYLNEPSTNKNGSNHGKQTTSDELKDYSISMIDLLNEYLSDDTGLEPKN